MIKLFLACFIAIALLTRTDPGSANEYSRFGTVESLVRRGTFQLDDSSFITTVDKIYRDGHYYSHQPPLLPVLEAPVYWVISLPGIRFNNRGRSVMTYLFILLTNGIALALTVVVMAKILELGGVGPGGRDVLAILLVFGTWLLPYGIVSSSHGISGLLVAVLTYQLLLSLSAPITPMRALGMGVVLGLLVVIEMLPVISFLPLTIIYFVAAGALTPRAWGAFAGGLAMPLLAHAILNVRITGDLIPAGFHTELFNYPGSVFDESSLTGTLKYHSIGAAADYAWTALFTRKGFLTFAPVRLAGLIAGVTAWRWWARARGVHLVLLGSIVLSLGAALLMTNNYGGEAVGFRHGVYLAPAFVVLLLPWLADGPDGRRQAGRVIVLGIAALSTALLLIFAVPEPWSPLSWSTASIGRWDEYLPVAGKLFSSVSPPAVSK